MAPSKQRNGVGIVSIIRNPSIIFFHAICIRSFWSFSLRRTNANKVFKGQHKELRQQRPISKDAQHSKYKNIGIELEMWLCWESACLTWVKFQVQSPALHKPRHSYTQLQSQHSRARGRRIEKSGSLLARIKASWVTWNLITLPKKITE